MALSNEQEKVLREIAGAVEGLRVAVGKELQDLRRQIRTLHTSMGGLRFVEALPGQDPEGKVWAVGQAGKWHVRDARFLSNLSQGFNVPVETWDINDINKYPTLPKTN